GRSVRNLFRVRPVMKTLSANSQFPIEYTISYDGVLTHIRPVREFSIIELFEKYGDLLWEICCGKMERTNTMSPSSSVSSTSFCSVASSARSDRTRSTS